LDLAKIFVPASFSLLRTAKEPQNTHIKARHRRDPMLKDKRTDLDAEKQKHLIFRLINELSKSQPDLYYLPTTEVARLLRDYAKDDTSINADDRTLFNQLSQRDIEVLLSIH
jgi:hypothetical protein